MNEFTTFAFSAFCCVYYSGTTRHLGRQSDMQRASTFILYKPVAIAARVQSLDKRVSCCFDFVHMNSHFHVIHSHERRRNHFLPFKLFRATWRSKNINTSRRYLWLQTQISLPCLGMFLEKFYFPEISDQIFLAFQGH